MNRQKLREYGGHILEDGTLEMRNVNDNAQRRFQYKLVDGRPSSRILPEQGDYDPPVPWGTLNLGEIREAYGTTYNPVLDYFDYQGRE